MSNTTENHTFRNLIELTKYFESEDVCVDYLIKLRWNGEPTCPYENCKHNKVYKMVKGKLKCAKCRKIFSVRVGSIFENSPIPLQKWFVAIYLITSHKKGISSLQLGKDLGITQKSAWHVLHRVRFAMRTQSFNMPLEGTIEADETYIGGKTKNKHRSKRIGNYTHLHAKLRR